MRKIRRNVALSSAIAAHSSTMSQHHIIVAIDGSDASKKATQWAASLLQEKDDLHIVTVRMRDVASLHIHGVGAHPCTHRLLTRQSSIRVAYWESACGHQRPSLILLFNAGRRMLSRPQKQRLPRRSCSSPTLP